MGQPRSAEAFFNEKGELQRMIGTIQNITERKQAEEDLRRLSAAVKQSPASIVIFDLEGRIEYVNPKYLQVTGYSEEEVIGKKVCAVNCSDTPEKLCEELWDTIINGGEWRGEILNKNKNEEIIWESVVVSPIKNKNDKIINFVMVKEDITAKKSAEEEIRLLAYALESINEGVSITDKNDKITYVNDAFCKNYGYAKEELFGKDPSIFRPDYNPDAKASEILPRTLQGGWKGELLNKRKNGEEFPIYLSTSVIHDENGNPVALMGVSTDITERRKVEESLILAKERAEEMNRLKSNFLANMSHELRTPMIGILGFSEILLSTITDNEMLQMVETINTSGNRLLHTLNQLLNLSRIEADKLELNLKELDIVPIIKDSAKLFEGIARKRNLFLKEEIRKDILISKVDENLVSLVLNNLLNNAVKFTNKGGITIIADKEFVDGKYWSSISVVDTGIGIPKDALQIIFEEFRQVSEGLNRSYEGTGLGLTLSQRAVQLMGGFIEVESSLNKGSKFTVRFLSFENNK